MHGLACLVNEIAYLCKYQLMSAITIIFLVLKKYLFFFTSNLQLSNRWMEVAIAVCYP